MESSARPIPSKISDGVAELLHYWTRSTRSKFPTSRGPTGRDHREVGLGRRRPRGRPSRGMDRLDAADRALDHEWRLRRSLRMAARRGSLRRDLAAALLQP